jgi:hypothetical protein
MSYHVIAWREGRHEGFAVKDAALKNLTSGERILRTVETLSAAERIVDRMRRGADRAEEIASGVPPQEDECDFGS